MLLAGVAAVASTLTFAAAGSAADLPPPVIEGFDAYARRGDGAAEALRGWLKDSPLNRLTDLGQLTAQLQRIEQVCGGYSGWRGLGETRLSETTRILYLQIDYADCPLFARFTAYSGGGRWVVTQLTFKTDPADVLPASLLEPKP